MKLNLREALYMDAPPAEVFRCAILDVEALGRASTPVWPLPGAVRTELVGARELGLGATRRVHLSDGTTLNEQVVAFDPPHHIAHVQTTPFAFPFSLLVRGGRTDIHLHPSGRGTDFVWGLSFELTTPLAYPLALLIGRALLMRMFRSGLRNIAAWAARPPQVSDSSSSSLQSEA